jgi:hypothetical protein
VHTLEKSLSIQWSHGSASERVFHREAFALDYWPTAAARLSDSRLSTGISIVVAGKEPESGATRIERWEFAHPQLPGPATPSAVTRTVLFAEDVAGKRGVRLLAPVNGVQAKAFVHFADSDDFYLLDGQSGGLTLLATPVQVPKLTSDALLFVSSGRTKAGRYVYVYQSEFQTSDQGALVLYDDEGDGSIEAWTPLADVYAWEDFFATIELQETYSN